MSQSTDFKPQKKRKAVPFPHFPESSNGVCSIKGSVKSVFLPTKIADEIRFLDTSNTKITCEKQRPFSSMSISTLDKLYLQECIPTNHNFSKSLALH